MKYTLNGHQKLTDMGKVGLVLTLASPVAGAGAWLWYLSTLTLTSYNSGGQLLPILCMFACGFGAVLGPILLLIGRSFHYIAEAVLPTTTTKGLWQN